MLPTLGKRQLIFLIYFLLLIQTSDVALAASSQVIEMEGYFRMIWGLLIVLGIIFALYCLLRKRFSLLADSPEKIIKVIEMKSLMGKKSLCLVSVRGNEYLLGLNGDRINHLATLPHKSERSFAATLQSAETNNRP
jgi:flagellar protein FliO/FliZ